MHRGLRLNAFVSQVVLVGARHTHRRSPPRLTRSSGAIDDDRCILRHFSFGHMMYSTILSRMTSSSSINCAAARNAAKAKHRQCTPRDFKLAKMNSTSGKELAHKPHTCAATKQYKREHRSVMGTNVIPTAWNRPFASVHVILVDWRPIKQSLVYAA